MSPVKDNIKILGVADGDPYSAQTWSGSSSYFFNALNKKGYLYEAFSALPPKITDYFYQLLSFHPNMAKWKFKYHIDVDHYNQMTKIALKKIKELGGSDFNVILQIGAWYDLTSLKDKVRVSYHDGNLHTLLKSPYGYPKITDKYIKRTLNYEKNIYDKADYIFTMSKWLADSFVRDFGIKASKLIPIGAGVNLPHVKQIENKSYQGKNILFIGRDFNRKGGPVLLDAFKKIRQELKDATLTVIGPALNDPPPGVRCLGFISKYSAHGIDRLLEEYSKATVFVMPSLYEPFGIVFAEAMAHKLPCVGTNICAMPEIIDNGINGYVVPPADADGLANKIIELLKDEKMCREFGENGFNKYLDNYKWEIVASRLVSAME